MSKSRGVRWPRCPFLGAPMLTTHIRQSTSRGCLLQVGRAAVGTEVLSPYPSHTHRKSCAYPTGSPYPQNPKILHTHTRTVFSLQEAWMIEIARILLSTSCRANFSGTSTRIRSFDFACNFAASSFFDILIKSTSANAVVICKCNAPLLAYVHIFQENQIT